METILDELSLVPCLDVPVAERIFQLANTLKMLDALGAPRVLRSVRDAADRDIEAGRGLKNWCCDRQVEQTARMLIASRLSKQPFIDGADGLFAGMEGVRAVEASVAGKVALGAGLAALTDSVLVALKPVIDPSATKLTVQLHFLDEQGETEGEIAIARFLDADQVNAERLRIIALIDASVSNGRELLRRQMELFPLLRIGDLALTQLRALSGNEIVFRQLLRHLRALNDAAKSNALFEPVGICKSAESSPTLNHSKFGPQRDFPIPEGFDYQRWSDHSKLTGGAGHRLYFRAEKVESGYLVLIGYFGPHLSTVSHKV
jgi:phage FluMu protein gp41